MPFPPRRQAGRTSPAETAGEPAIEGPGSLGRLFSARAEIISSARQLRVLGRKLERTAERLDEGQAQLQQFKLYPPYPADEPRRAQTIREFNGLADEIERLSDEGTPPKVTLPRLAETALPGDADVVLGRIEYVRVQVETVRVTLQASVASGDGTEAAAASGDIGRLLGDDLTGISRSASDLLRQLT